jgi:hypothetical protein
MRRKAWGTIKSLKGVGAISNLERGVARHYPPSVRSIRISPLFCTKSVQKRA